MCCSYNSFHMSSSNPWQEIGNGKLVDHTPKPASRISTAFLSFQMIWFFSETTKPRLLMDWAGCGNVLIKRGPLVNVHYLNKRLAAARNCSRYCWDPSKALHLLQQELKTAIRLQADQLPVLIELIRDAIDPSKSSFNYVMQQIPRINPIISHLSRFLSSDRLHKIPQQPSSNQTTRGNTWQFLGQPSKFASLTYKPRQCTSSWQTRFVSNDLDHLQSCFL